jgi:hypothetical protein
MTITTIDTTAQNWHWTYEPLINIMNRVLITNHKIEATDINSHMRRVGEFVIENIAIEHAYVRSIQLRLWNGFTLTAPQIAAVYRILAEQYADRVCQIARDEAKAKDHDGYQAAIDNALNRSARPMLNLGKYTVTDNTGSQYRTIRLSDCPDRYNKPKGTQIAAFLSGPGNTADYTGFAFIYPGRKPYIFQRFQSNQQLRYALGVLLESDDGVAYGKLYALESNRCWRCDKLLTTPESILNGIGPHCAKTIGLDREPARDLLVKTASDDSDLFPESRV